PEINQNTVLAKNIILDICAVDETGRVIDIEMQMAGNNNSESARFQFYGARLLVEQLDAGEKYNMLRPVYQIIFINDDDDCLIRDYAYRDSNGRMEKGNLNYRYFIKMKHIEKILKEKEVKELSDLERLCYLFIKNEYTDIIKEKEEDIIGMVINMYDKFRNNEPMWSIANQLALARIRTESFKDEYHSKGLEEGIEIGIKQGLEKGMKEGLEQGIEIGKKEMFIEMVERRYHQKCREWIEGLSEKQLKLINKYIFEEDEFEAFKQRIDNSN
uniref:PD-(D/E)XK nuclease family transposase n=2 Tax=Thomasclavelia cocleata TaxID=69824 RepID=UPI00248AAB15